MTQYRKPYGTTVIFLYIIVIFLIGAIYSFPQTDDFCTFGRIFAHNGNPFSESFFLYQNWTGRYASSFLISIPAWIATISPVNIFKIYQLFVFLSIISLPFSIYLFFRRSGLDRLYSALLSSIATSAALIIIPSKIEALYWFTGAAVYFVPVAFLFLLAERIESDREKKHPTLPSALSIFYLLFLVGLNELIAITAGFLIFIHYLFNSRNKEASIRIFVLAAIFIMALLLTGLAPGNFARNAKDVSFVVAQKHNLFSSFHLAISSLKVLWSYDVVGHYTTLLYGALGAVAIGALTGLQGYHIRQRIILPLVLSAILSIPLQLAAYSFLTGDASPGRILNQATILLCSSIIILIATFANNISSLFTDPKHHWVEKFLVFISIISAAGLVTDKNFKDVNLDMKVFAPLWAKEQQHRDNFIRQSIFNNKKILEVPAYSKEPNLSPIFQGMDITSDPKYWVNTCVASYYGATSIKLLTK